ncbi:hypothetical protein MIB92_18315 [Aestuariirhabdus sp. Z084]|uniref:hypothetical protein n=1 Tax=Aestuariirhabdus haliotis TaxID=2918751 RepID=UPI00201B3986|nr:hypothetical protein [Aestuariirhabdus haliotis]MCL6417620.1 hypothetical protein [Aestuariirhabdus haliotis]MCL6421546.1 hypothetical protein [Aestuariirhabdus haliotis]
MPKILNGIIAVLSVFIVLKSMDIFGAVGHKDYTFDTVCTNQVKISAPENIKSEHQAECERLKQNVPTGFLTALNNAPLIGISAFLVFLISVYQLFNKHGRSSKAG